MSRTYRLPSGELVSDGATYVDAWQAYLQPAAEFLGATVSGFDPGAMFLFPNGRAWTLEPHELHQLLQAIEREHAQT